MGRDKVNSGRGLAPSAGAALAASKRSPRCLIIELLLQVRNGCRLATAIGVAVIVVCTRAPGFAQGPPPGSPGSTTAGAVANTPAISGTVVDAVTGQPLAGAVASLGQSGSVDRQATDGAGRFLFSILSIMTTYGLTASKPGYLDGAFGGDWRPGAGRLQTAAGQPATRRRHGSAGSADRAVGIRLE